MARSGSLLRYLPTHPSLPRALASLKASSTPFTEIIHVGHSFGSFLSASLLARYGNISDAAILTGYIPSTHGAEIKLSSFGMELARSNSPKLFHDRGSGYIVQATPSNVHTIFFKAPAFDRKVLDYAYSIRQPITVGEYTSISALNLGPVLFMEAEFDFPICGGDCRGGWNLKTLKGIYGNATDVEVYLQPGAGHGLVFHKNATAGFEVMGKWLGKNGM